MPTTIGKVTNRETGDDTLARSRARAALIPDLLVEASRVANNVHSGWHGRRKRGVGENFWQFRPYVSGENISAIDWRRSARDDHIYIKDREWQAAHTIWLWVDESASMLYKSNRAQVSKQSRALVLAFATAELLARSGERVGWLGVRSPITSRNAAQSLASSLALSPTQEVFPELSGVRNHSEAVIFSDFLDPLEQTIERMQKLAHRGARGHLVQLIDPAETYFPYKGRIEFSDPETGKKYVCGNAGKLKDDYAAIFEARIEQLKKYAAKLGWSHTTHTTDNLASGALITLHAHLSGNPPPANTNMPLGVPS